MKRSTGRCCLLAGWLAVAAAQPTGAQSTRPASAGETRAEARTGQDVDARARALARKVLADPLDAAARDELAALRRTQRQRDLAGFRALAQGLRAYLDAGAEFAAPALAKAVGSARAVSLTASLPRPLGKLLPGPASAPAEAGKLCRKCGNTGWADCTAARCNASGMVPCSACRGLGVIRIERAVPRAPVYRLCGECGGTGVVRCPQCNGSGVVPCTACRSHARASRGNRAADPAEARKIREVICKARRLGRGRIDLYTRDALKPSPK